MRRLVHCRTGSDRDTRAGRLTNAALYVLNVVFILTYVLSTYDLRAPYPTLVRVAEVGLGVVFLGEYVVRVYSAESARAEVTDVPIFFITTGFFYAVEEHANPDIANSGDAFYYTVIAVSTVGFGDIIPTTTAGRWVTVVAVLVGFVLVPWQASRLRDLGDVPDATCPACDHPVDEYDRYCRACGAALDDGTRGDEAGSD